MPRRRELKDPQERKQEILDAAMTLFSIQGYEQTSMRDIARYLNISLGLCYRYFDSKNILFQEAMQQYVEKCCAIVITILQNPEYNLHEKLQLFSEMIMKEDQIYEYHEFFHQPENSTLHEQLGLRICQYLEPYLLEELQHYAQQQNIKIKDPETLISFITYGQIGLFANQNIPNQFIIESIQHYIEVLMISESIPEQ